MPANDKGPNELYSSTCMRSSGVWLPLATADNFQAVRRQAFQAVQLAELQYRDLSLGHRAYDEEKQEWSWTRAPPVSQKLGGDPSSSPKKARKKVHPPVSYSQNW